MAECAMAINVMNWRVLQEPEGVRGENGASVGRASSPAPIRRSASVALGRRTDSAKPYGDVHAPDHESLRRVRQLVQLEVVNRYVDGLPILVDEVMVIGHSAVEERAIPARVDMPNEPDFGEELNRVVDRRQTHRQLRSEDLLVEHLRREVTVTSAEHQPCQSESLSGQA